MRLKIKSGPRPGEPYEELSLDGKPLDARSIEIDMHVDRFPTARVELYADELDIDIEVERAERTRKAARLTDLQALERTLGLLDPSGVARLLDVARELVGDAMRKAATLEAGGLDRFAAPLEPSATSEVRNG